MSAPIEDYLDELLRRTRADARSTRRLLDEAADHLYTAAADLSAAGMPRAQAEAEAVRRFGAATVVGRVASRRSLLALVVDTAAAAVQLAGWGLAAVGVSGLVAWVMNDVGGQAFVGGQTLLRHGASQAEVAHDAVALRVLAGLVGVVLLVLHRLRSRERPTQVLPAGMVDVLGAAAFAAASVLLAGASIDQAVQTGTDGVGFALSGALVALPAAVIFCVRAVRAIVPFHPTSPDVSA